MTSLYQKLVSADQVCSDCGNKYGKYSVGCSSVWEGTCDVCGETKGVTEVRDYGYLSKGLRELGAQTRPFSELTKDFTPERKTKIEQQSAKLAKQMKETEEEVTYRSAITGICIYRKDNFRTLQTEVKLVDEGGGEFISIMDDQGQEVRLDFEEFDEVVKAVAMLRAQ